jgi:dihydrofolate synthase/folylpolyglutamate synthase
MLSCRPIRPVLAYLVLIGVFCMSFVRKIPYTCRHSSTLLMSELYPESLRNFYGLNARLRKDGISAPQEVSVANTKRVYDCIGRPLDSIPTLHIGGTNGKVGSLPRLTSMYLIIKCSRALQGTTSFKLCEALKNNGIRTGSFVSPHLASYRERIQVDSELLPEQSFVDNFRTLTAICREQGVAPTEFELTFLMAALYFKQAKCEAVVLEVGLGGEYDATNVVNTAVSVICSVCKSFAHVLIRA